jgi:hypothetical protein
MSRDDIPAGIAPALLRDETTHQMTTFNLERRSKTLLVAPGERVTIGEVSGHGHISNLWMTFPGWFWQHWNTGAPISQTILKTLILRIYWDDEDTPGVEAPVGDFFGLGLCEVANFTSRFFGMSSGGFFCKWPMPFRKGFRIEVENLDASITTDVFMNVLYQLHPVPKEAAYFHTEFRTGRSGGKDDLWIAEQEGRGHYAGVTLAMQGQNHGYLNYLEAPEYLYVDEDWDTPRIVGTGLEDYFMGGWYFREGCFAGMHHGVPVKDALNACVAMYRTHDDDAVHFRKRFRMAFLNPFDPSLIQPFVFSSAAFFYLDQPVSRRQPLPPREELLCWYRIRNCDHQSIP